MSTKIETTVRDRPLTSQEAAHDPEVRHMVKAEFPAADRFFSEDQQRRLAKHMTRWRAVRDQGTAISPAEQTEREQLAAAELEAATLRAAALLDPM